MTTATLQAEGAARPRAWMIWAAIGALCLLLQAYVFLRWFGSSDFRATPIGVDPVPSSVQTTLNTYQTVSVVIGTLALVWSVLGIVRHRSVDGWRLMMVGWLSAYWLDPWLNFLRPMFTYNSYMINRGCWCDFIPGWQSPQGSRISEPFVADIPCYFYYFTLVTAIAYWVMQGVKRRYPQTSWVVLTLTAFPVLWIVWSTFDMATTRLMGFDAWPISIHAITAWPGETYQFPLYEFVIFPAMFVLGAFLMMTRDEHGHTVLERGVEKLNGNGARIVVRLLIFVAFCNANNFAYTTILGVHALYGDAWPANMPSYLADEQCGPLTGRSCPTPRAP